MASWNWPPDFPDDCPPEDAVPANGTFYRITKDDPPNSRDFLSQYHKNRRLAERTISRGRGTQCDTMGISVFANKDDAIKRAKEVPRFGLGNKIASITLSPQSGKMRPKPWDGDSHYTWWPVRNFSPAAIASVETVL